MWLATRHFKVWGQTPRGAFISFQQHAGLVGKTDKGYNRDNVLTHRVKAYRDVILVEPWDDWMFSTLKLTEPAAINGAYIVR